MWNMLPLICGGSALLLATSSAVAAAPQMPQETIGKWCVEDPGYYVRDDSCPYEEAMVVTARGFQVVDSKCFLTRIAKRGSGYRMTFRCGGEGRIGTMTSNQNWRIESSRLYMGLRR